MEREGERERESVCVRERERGGEGVGRESYSYVDNICPFLLPSSEANNITVSLNANTNQHNIPLLYSWEEVLILYSGYSRPDNYTHTHIHTLNFHE